MEQLLEEGKKPGIYVPAPPTFVIPVCRICLEENCCCYALGPCGLPESCVDPNARNTGRNCRGIFKRHTLMYFAAFWSFVGLILLIVSGFGLATNSLLINAAWVSGEVTAANNPFNLTMGAKIYIGPGGIVALNDDGDVIQSRQWVDIPCDDATDEDTCEACIASAASMAFGVYSSIITQLPQLLTNFCRSTIAGDMNFYKGISMVTDIYGMYATLSAIEIFEDTALGTCGFTTDGKSVVDVGVGPGMVCIIIGTLLKIFDFILNAMLPTPQTRHAQGFKHRKVPRDGSGVGPRASATSNPMTESAATGRSN